jgi:hypothetical protein
MENLKREIQEVREKEHQDRLKFNVTGWTDEELELFEGNYNVSIDILMSLFPNKNKAELLRAQRDRINRELILNSVLWTKEEDQVLANNRQLPYNQLIKLLPNRSVWAIMRRKGILKLTNKRLKHEYKVLTPKDYHTLGVLRQQKIPTDKICQLVGITKAQFYQIFYAITDNKDILKFRKKYPSNRNYTVHKYWTESENQMVIQLYNDNITVEDMADLFGVTLQKMRNKLANLGLKKFNTRFKEQQKLQKEQKAKEKEQEYECSEKYQQLITNVSADSIAENYKSYKYDQKNFKKVCFSIEPEMFEKWKKFLNENKLNGSMLMRSFVYTMIGKTN